MTKFYQFDLYVRGSLFAAPEFHLDILFMCFEEIQNSPAKFRFSNFGQVFEHFFSI
jgi:hypothetical protein